MLQSIRTTAGRSAGAYGPQLAAQRFKSTKSKSKKHTIITNPKAQATTISAVPTTPKTTIPHAPAPSAASMQAAHTANTAHKLPPPDSDPTMGRIVAITSGKGGVGKTTSAASFAMGIASKSNTVCVVDFDIGLRNLDIHLGAERRVVFDFINVLNEECSLQQALIKDKRVEGLSMLAASQTKDKDSLTVEGVERVLNELCKKFDYVILDSPAGIESGAKHAMYFADDAVVVTNPELSSCRDADKMIGFISSRSRRAELGAKPVEMSLLITRYDADRAELGESLSITDIQELLGLDLVGVIPESKSILTCTNNGTPVITLEGKGDNAGGAYSDMVDRFLGADTPMRYVTPEEPSFFKRLFGK